MMNWIISSSVLILIVIALRCLLKGKISLRLQYGLWALVLIRLLVPISFGETALSIGTWLDQVGDTQEVQQVVEMTQTQLPSMSYNEAYQQVYKEYKEQGIDITTLPDAQFSETIEYEVLDTMNDGYTPEQIAKMIWLAGMFLVALWFIFTNARFSRKLEANREFLGTVAELTGGALTLRVYKTNDVETPCLYGFASPAIYVTDEVMEKEAGLRHVLEHESTHYRHGDHIWSVLRVACLILHWYNPLVWCAAFLSRRDAELACDEATIKRLGETERAAYGRTLIDLTCEKRPAVLITATTMTGSKQSIKERILLIAKKPETAAVTVVLVAFIITIAVGSTFTGAKLGYESFSKWAGALDANKMEWVQVVKGDGQEERYYPLTEAEEKRFCEILASIPEEKCYRRTQSVDEYYDYRAVFMYDGKDAFFKCLEDKTVLFVRHSEMPAFAPEWKDLIIDSPELWNYIVDTVREDGKESMTPEKAAEQIVGVTELGNTEQLYMTVYGGDETYKIFFLDKDGYEEKRLVAIAKNYKWTEIPEFDSSVAKQCVEISFDNPYVSVKGNRLVFWDVDKGVLEYAYDGKTYYWKAEKNGIATENAFDDVKHMYDSTEASCSFDFSDYMDDYDYVAKKIIYETYPDFINKLSSDNRLKFYDYRVIDWARTEYHEEGNYIKGWFDYAFRPSNPQHIAIYAGGVGEGTGEYEGMLVNRQYFFAEQIDDGYWMGYIYGGWDPELEAEAQ